MKMIHWNAYRLLKIVIVTLPVCSFFHVSGQTVSKNPATAQAPVYKARKSADTVPHNNQLRYNGKKDMNQQSKMVSKNGVTRVDTVTSFEQLLQMKSDCETVKTLDADGSILIRYPDGFSKKMNNGALIEITTADGVRHVTRRMPYTPVIHLAVIKVPPPIPGPNDPLYKWLKEFNTSLESDITDLIGQSGWSQLLSDESEVCNNNIYKQIQFRTKFLENYSTAH